MKFDIFKIVLGFSLLLGMNALEASSLLFYMMVLGTICHIGLSAHLVVTAISSINKRLFGEK